MIKSKKATSIIEAIIVLLIIVTWVTWMYTLFDKSTLLSNSTENKIQAIQIAKQWIEAITNIRDSNWIRFSSDFKNCWNTDVSKHIGVTCLWDTGNSLDILAWSYIVFRNNDNSWNLQSKTVNTFWLWSYINDYRVDLDTNWIYTQTWNLNNLYPIFTREVKISYLQSDWTTVWNTGDPKMKVISLVQWVDSSSTNPHKVELEQILSNWKEEN